MRNDMWCLKKKPFNAINFVLNIFGMEYGYNEACAIKNDVGRSVSIEPATSAVRRSPPMGLVKINIDEDTSKTTTHVGVL